MKKLIILIALTMSALSFADTSVPASSDELSILSRINNITRTYSATSELEAKVVEVLYGDGYNASRMILVLDNGYEGAKVFELGIMMVSVRRITFVAKDKIVINYVQDDFKGEEMNPYQVNRSVTIQVVRTAEGSIANEIKILE